MNDTILSFFDVQCTWKEEPIAHVQNIVSKDIDIEHFHAALTDCMVRFVKNQMAHFNNEYLDEIVLIAYHAIFDSTTTSWTLPFVNRIAKPCPNTFRTKNVLAN